MTRVTLVHQGCPDYLMDIVSDGLLRLLGRENLHISCNSVVQPPDYIRARMYEKFRKPNTFDFFDGDAIIVSTRSPKVLIDNWISRTGGKRRVAVVDGEDDTTIRDSFRSVASVYFKRELYRVRENIKPLPFGAFPEEVEAGVERNRPVAFRGALRNEIRNHVSEHLRKMKLQEDAQILSKEAYNRSLLSARVGISVRGAGWDTYRYWETAYFGCALLSERLPILIPENFIDGLEAVFFSSFGEFKEILEGLLGDAEVTRRLGENARKACLARHLSIHRAKAILSEIIP